MNRLEGRSRRQVMINALGNDIEDILIGCPALSIFPSAREF